MFNELLFGDAISNAIWIAGVVGGVLFLLLILAVSLNKFYRKVSPDQAIVRTGVGGVKTASGGGMFVIPLAHQAEVMDLSVKRIEIKRHGKEGLICMDNIRADIEVAFYLRISENNIENVAKKLGAKRASSKEALVELFDAQFSEALKTIGKRFDFVDLYTDRDRFKGEITELLGDPEDLQGYELVSTAIDYLEQTSLDSMNSKNILDAEGIKKITDLTAREAVQANDIEREKEKAIVKQDVEAREAILALERQQVEAEQRQQREIEEVTARETAQGAVVREEERLRSEARRILTEEELQVAEENKDRQIIVARKNKERTEAVETERVERDRGLEATDRERVVALADIDKDKAIEVEKRNIQEVIRERVIVERGVVEETERIKDTEQFATVDRLKRVTVTKADMEAEESLVKEVKAADAQKQAAERNAEQVVIEAEADRQRAEKETQAIKMLAEAKTADQAASGLAEAQVQEAKATSKEKDGFAEASVLQRTAEAEALGMVAKADGIEKEGTAEAEVMKLKYSSEAQGIEEKANAMKLFDDVGKDHEEFKIRLNKDKDIEIAAIDAQRLIAEAQSNIMGEALKNARIDIVGGESTFFDQVVNAVKGGKVVDRFVDNSGVLTDIKDTFFNGDPEYFQSRILKLVDQFDLSTDDVKDLSIAALIAKMIGLAKTDSVRNELQGLLGMAKNKGISDTNAGEVMTVDSRGSADG
ncbi:MAG: flotillin family protein [Planctomycetota bacterium]|nr:flotillin family protein [Planctomycetota bacterium]